MNIAKINILSRVLDDRCDDRDFVIVMRVKKFYFCRILSIIMIIVVVVVVIVKIIACSVWRDDTSI